MESLYFSLGKAQQWVSFTDFCDGSTDLFVYCLDGRESGGIISGRARVNQVSESIQ